MFICDITKKVSVAGEKPTVVVSKKRKKSYDNGTSFGWEIVEEMRLSSEGLRIWREKNCAAGVDEALEASSYPPGSVLPGASPLNKGFAPTIMDAFIGKH